MKKKSKGKLTPKLRFPEFRDASEWVDGRCDDIAVVLQGYGFPERHQGSPTGKYPFYKVSDISSAVEHGEKYITQSKNYIEDDVLSELGAKLIPEGTTIFAKIGEAIRSNRRAITKMPSVVDNNVAGVKAIPGKASDEFLFYLWSNIPLIDFAGGVVPAISKSAIETIPVAYTRIDDEQQKIVDCLSSLDGLMAAEGRALEALKAHKKGLMQQLFPQPGETQPHLRFSEFRDRKPWKNKEVGDVFDIKRGQVLAMPLVRDIESIDMPYPVYSSRTRDQGLSGYYSEYLFEDAITWTTDGANAGDVNYRPGKFYCTNVCGVLLSDEGYANHCIAALLNSVTRDHVSYVGNPKLMNGVMAKIVIPFPEHDEQQRISDCLSALDTLIAAQAEKIDALKTHKRGLMQQLFPAPEEQL